MTRRFLDDIRAEANAIPSGSKLPWQTLKGIMLDTMDSVIQDECLIGSNTPTSGIGTTTDWQPIDTGFDVAVGGDGNFLKPNELSGEIQTSSTPGFTYEIAGAISFADLGQNTEIDFSVLRNGEQVGFVASLTGGGGSRPRGADFTFTDLAAPADAVYTVGVRTPTGIQDIDVLSIGLSVTVKPTNNP